jgi:amino acid adenylation domain-containing protein
MEELLLRIANHNIDVKVENGNLELDIPNGLDVGNILNDIKNNKEALIKYILNRVSGKPDYRVIEKAAVKDKYVLSSAQKRLFFLYEMDKKSMAYNMPQFIKLSKDFDRDRLTIIVKKLIDRHETLRTYFELIDGEPFQRIAAEADFEIEVLKTDIAELNAAFERMLQPFCLSTPPLMRVGLVETSSDEHFLMIDMHHIITDGISKSLLMKDFFAFYNNEELPELKLQYKDFSEWQLQEEQNANTTLLRQFWMNEFAENVTALELPADFHRPRIKDFKGSFVNFELNPFETKQLKLLAEKEGCTMFMILLAAFNILLSKLSNQENIIVGTPTAGRQHDDLENIIGMFVNTLMLRNYPVSDLSVKEFLSSVRSKTLSCFDHQNYQLETLIDQLKIERDTSRNPLFEVMFSYQNLEHSEFNSPDLAFSFYQGEDAISQFDLTLSAFDKGAQISLNFEYATALFKKETIERFSGYFKKIISDIISNVNRKIADIDMLSAEEKQMLLIEFNNTYADYPTEKTIIAEFEEQVHKTPENISLIYGEKKITYAYLNERANQLATYLRKKNATEGSVIGLLADRSFEMIIGLIAIMKAGASYLPLDTALPEDRILQMIKDSGVIMLLTDENKHKKFSQHIKTCNLSDDEINKEQKTNLQLHRSSSSIAYIIYTSGSTGSPKGVMISHRSVMNLIHSQTKLHGVDETDKILQFSTIAFDASVEQIWLALLNGASLVLINKDILRDQQLFNEYIADQGITHLDVTPSFLESLNLVDASALKRIIIGGEECKALLAKKLASRYALYNEYGPTETTVTSIARKIEPSDMTGIKIPIGKPINNTKAYILGSRQELLPIGSAGELCIGGDGLAKGYLNDALLTATKFINNPFIPKQHIYRTGDKARWLPGGNIEFLGRLDEQVKIRGFRIELGEIETLLGKYELIKEVVVIVKEEENEKQIIAYYVAEAAIDSSKLYEFLSGKLPDYMIPLYFVHLKNLPVNMNGKVNRKALPVPERIAGADYLPPTNETEEKLTAIWAEVLRIDKKVISINKSFFELGGHSLSTIRLGFLIKKEFDYEISLTDIFKSPTIKAIARQLQFNDIKIEKTTNCLTLLKKDKKTSPNLFFVHDGSGDIQGYIKLTEQLHTYNCWGIRSKTLEGFEPRNTSVEQLAESYLKDIRSMQAIGPYNIAGWSYGGLIALEITKQLEKAGEQVDLLLIIDSQFPFAELNDKAPEIKEFSWADEKSLLSNLFENKIEHLEHTKTIAELWTKTVPLLKESTVSFESIKNYVPVDFRTIIPHFDQLSVEQLVAYVNTIRTLENALMRYQPLNQIAASILYIKAAESACNRELIESYFTQEIQFVEIPGNHFSIMEEPVVSQLVRGIEEYVQALSIL